MSSENRRISSTVTVSPGEVRLDQVLIDRFFTRCAGKGVERTLSGGLGHLQRAVSLEGMCPDLLAVVSTPETIPERPWRWSRCRESSPVGRRVGEPNDEQRSCRVLRGEAGAMETALEHQSGRSARSRQGRSAAGSALEMLCGQGNPEIQDSVDDDNSITYKERGRQVTSQHETKRA